MSSCESRDPFDKILGFRAHGGPFQLRGCLKSGAVSWES